MKPNLLKTHRLRTSLILLAAAGMLSFSGCNDDDDDPVIEAVCGNGVVEGVEQCDDGDDNSDTKADACRTDCTFPICGDGVVDANEECDEGADGNDGTTCNENCTLPDNVVAVCGDGVVEGDEECDDGDDNSDTEIDACREDCTLAACGDDVVDTGEECDNGDLNSDTEPNACRMDCAAPSCGDGVVDTGEECDNGTNDGTLCEADCKLPAGYVPVCGNGVVEGAEECDDGDDNSDTEPDACRTDCTDAACGDGVVDASEECDEGPEGNDGTTCTAECMEPVSSVTTSIRWNELSIIAPMFHMAGGTEQDPTCEESDELINTVLGSLLTEADEDDGDKYGLNIVQTLDTPLPDAGGEITAQMSFPETCVAVDGDTDTCELTGSDSISWTFVEPVQSGPCFERIPATPNADDWVDHPELTLDPAAIPNQGPNACLMGETGSTFTISIMGYDIPLNGAYMSMELDESGTTPEVASGLLGGFITAADAEALNFLDIVIFSALLNGGAGACIDTVDLDVGPDGAGGTTEGWWLYVSFAGDAVSTD